MSPSSPTPPVPNLPGSSPLVERIDPDTDYIHVTAAFGDRLTVVQFKTQGQPEGTQDSVPAVTVHGSGWIEYHLPARQTPDVAAPVTEADRLRARLAAVEDLIARATQQGVATIDRVLVARAAGGA
ncbi:hypothetical protein ACFQ2B_27605 [Streptomyces stramineus]|uniref:Uncharacterized protein n=1 Tax=Streptomyces stramineus TaxID=173861 RepID=A0ABN0ZNJ2_9ACTN